MLSLGKMTLPNRQVVQFNYPSKLHLPRYLEGRGIQNYEPITLAAFLACAERSEKAVYDIGENIGIYALSAAAATPRRVFAFEPFGPPREVMDFISRTYDLQVEIVAAAVGETPGRTSFYISSRSDMSNSLNETFRQHAAVEMVDVVSVDSFADRGPAPGVVKIDTETTEISVLRGSIETIRVHRPTFIIEVLGEEFANDIRAMFEPFGYALFEVGGSEFRSGLTALDGVDCTSDQRNWVIYPYRNDRTFIGAVDRWIAVLKSLPIV